ncbi:hypothetical protein EBR96_00800, partial [bacterium]|nr:hypothetical protein [bacterium]
QIIASSTMSGMEAYANPDDKGHQKLLSDCWGYQARSTAYLNTIKQQEALEISPLQGFVLHRNRIGRELDRLVINGGVGGPSSPYFRLSPQFGIHRGRACFSTNASRPESAFGTAARLIRVGLTILKR